MRKKGRDLSTIPDVRGSESGGILCLLMERGATITHLPHSPMNRREKVTGLGGRPIYCFGVLFMVLAIGLAHFDFDQKINPLLSQSNLQMDLLLEK